MEQWLQKAAAMQPHDFVFQAFDSSESSPVPACAGRQLSYPQARYHVLAQVAVQLGISHKEASSQFGLHSLRSGGATQCALKGVEERLFQAHGGWRSKEAMHAYIKESLEHRLAPSAALGY
jgi:hypothetical protein